MCPSIPICRLHVNARKCIKKIKKKLWCCYRDRSYLSECYCNLFSLNIKDYIRDSLIQTADTSYLYFHMHIVKFTCLTDCFSIVLLSCLMLWSSACLLDSEFLDYHFQIACRTVCLIFDHCLFYWPHLCLLFWIYTLNSFAK